MNIYFIARNFILKFKNIKRNKISIEYVNILIRKMANNNKLSTLLTKINYN